MTKLLVSVRSAAEATLALGAGVDLIDVKEPRKGSLGAADQAVWREVAQAIADARPLSAALGELADFAPPGDLAPLSGYRFAKLGLARCAGALDWPQRWEQSLARLPNTVSPVAVVYADYSWAEAPQPGEILAVGNRLGCGALLVDTFSKATGSVLDVIDRSELIDVLAEARGRGMLTVLAGSLRLERLDEALSLGPDYIALRGAVCRGTRADQLDRTLISMWRERLASWEGLRLDARLPAARTE